MATPVVSKKVYITGSAYVLKVYGMSEYNSIKVSLQVVGSLASSRLDYQVWLRRGTTDITSPPRTGSIPQKSTRTILFTNVRNEGKLNVHFYLEKKGGTPGSTIAFFDVPK